MLSTLSLCCHCPLTCQVLGRWFRKDPDMEAGEEHVKSLLQCCAVRLFPTAIGIILSFTQKRNCRFVICLLILPSWRSFKLQKCSNGEDLNLCCLKAVAMVVQYPNILPLRQLLCLFLLSSLQNKRAFWWLLFFLILGLKVPVFSISTSCFRQLFGRDQRYASGSTHPLEGKKPKTQQPKKLTINQSKPT